jgi:hypothetical protein
LRERGTEKGRYRDEEPFVDGGIDGRGGLIVARRDLRSLVLVDTEGRIGDREIQPNH